ncbi:MAG: cytoplasmic protein [Paenibacillus sp. RIFOXYA1_FULL_44_5]|nr:MAG: cytoplasmic protein [Paenibacillus sp. RIFOXYA1_FULL_44_5]
MTIYIALLRGINVSGHNKIKMAELRGMLETLGLSRVQTYIQSGNILFESGEGRETLRIRIEDEIRTAFGLSITVVLRTAEELERIIADCPYGNIALREGESVHVSVLTEAPPQKVIDLLADSERDNDEYRINGSEIYFLFRQSILDSKLGKKLQKLGNTVTTRNWTTINKLAALAKAMQA